MTKDIYSQAAYAAYQNGMKIDSVMERLKEVLDKRGHMALYERVLIDLQEIITQATETPTKITLAQLEDRKKHEQEITKILSEYKITEEPEYVADETIVGGFIIESKDKMVDRSYKRSLVSLYRSVIS